MNELITINYESERPTVSGRELHKFLEVDSNYTTWFKRMCEYGFVEDSDFVTCFPNLESEKQGGQNKTDHALIIPMAKELARLQRTEKGKQARQYFISCEEAWNSPDKIMERAFQIARQRALETERRIFGLLEDKETLEIALNESLKFYTVAKYNKSFNMNWSLAKCQELGKHLSAYCRVRAIEIRKCETNDERFGVVNSYPLTAWEGFMERGMIA